MTEIHLFCPATIANLSCGFDVLGLCLQSVGDDMVVRVSAVPGIQIKTITGADLPTDPEKNVAGVAALALLKALNDPTLGFEIDIHKKIKAGSGIGSSAASSAGAVFGINYLLGEPFSRTQLVDFAMEGEKAATGNRHADNVAPALLGGITLVRATDPLDIVSIPAPEGLTAVVVHPQIEVKTADARALLPKEVPLATAVKQWGNVGALVAALYCTDFELLGRSLTDVIVEPHRKKLIPDFDRITELMKANGALGAGISGSGPSIFALCKNAEIAQNLVKLLTLDRPNWQVTDADIHWSGVNNEGVREI